MAQLTEPLEGDQELPFMLGFSEEVDLSDPSYTAVAGGTQYSTNSGGRESGYDEDP